VPPFAAYLIAAFGWRAAYLTLGAFALVVGAGLAFLIDDDPRRRGLGPDGDVVPTDMPLPQAAGAAVGKAICSPRFIGLYAACFICAFGLFVPFVHLVPYALDHGIAQNSAVLLLGAIGVGSTAGRFLLGGLADRLGRPLSFLMMFLGIGLSFVIWAVSTTFLPLAVFALVYGVFYGGFVALAPAVVIDYFGGRNAGSLIGILYTSVAFGTLVGPTAAGYAYDISHSYLLPILISVGANFVAAAILAATAKTAAAR